MGLNSYVKSITASQSGGTLGTRVFLPATVCPTGAVWTTLFTVSGGLVLMTMLVGERTIIQAAGASNLSIRVNPTAGAVVAFCAATVVTADAVGTIYTFTGNPADACYAGLAVQAGMSGGLLATGMNTHGWIVPPGTVQWNEDAAAGTGSVQWTMRYVPIDPEAYVV